MQRSTRQRAAIEAALRTARRPLTPGEILETAKSRVPALGTATVYRTLKSLMNEGAVVAVHLPGEAPRFEVAHLGHHHHFRCRECDRVFEVDGCPGDLASLAPAGFRVDSHDVVLFGRCANCGAHSP
jgi:Fur family ferric uptake transcriptional regulator